MIFRYFFLVFLLVIYSCESEPAGIKVACIGDSITYGYGIEERAQNCYPAQLQNILGPAYRVKNFGVSGATLLDKGDRPYRLETAFADAKAFRPNVVVIKLGTNDSKPHNWQYHNQFVSDYRLLIKEFQSLESAPKIWLVKPAPVFRQDINIKDTIIKNEVLPLIDSIAQLENLPIIDLYQALSRNASMFPDGVHPDADASGIMAGIIGASISVNEE